MSLTCHIDREIYMYLRYVKKDGKKLCPFDLKSLDCIFPDRKVQGANMGRTCVGPMLALWTLLSGIASKLKTTNIYEMKYMPLLIWLVAFRLFSAKLLPNQCSLDSEEMPDKILFRSYEAFCTFVTQLLGSKSHQLIFYTDTIYPAIHIMHSNLYMRLVSRIHTDKYTHASWHTFGWPCYVDYHWLDFTNFLIYHKLHPNGCQW